MMLEHKISFIFDGIKQYVQFRWNHGAALNGHGDIRAITFPVLTCAHVHLCIVSGFGTNAPVYAYSGHVCTLTIEQFGADFTRPNCGWQCLDHDRKKDESHTLKYAMHVC